MTVLTPGEETKFIVIASEILFAQYRDVAAFTFPFLFTLYSVNTIYLVSSQSILFIYIMISS